MDMTKIIPGDVALLHRYGRFFGLITDNNSATFQLALRRISPLNVKAKFEWRVKRNET